VETIDVDVEVGTSVGKVSGIYQAQSDLRAVYAFAHGAGASMRHPFMERVAFHLAEGGIATLRYNFPYMEAGRQRPDPPGVLEATVRAAIDAAAELANDVPLLAGGKSMGGRMTSQALAKRTDARVRGIVFVGFPLHQPGKPAMDRAAHLYDIQVPMLFLQGTRDSLANIDLMTQLCDSLGNRATLHIIDDADHSFAVPKRTGKTSDDVYRELASTIDGFSRTVG
jgi:predicted alpha/beta-hydrolase family hydrolase